MSITAFCSVILILSLVAIGFAVFVWIRLIRRERNRGNRDQRRITLAPFHAFVIGFFLSGVILFYPAYYEGDAAGAGGLLRVLEALLLSVRNVLQFFALDGDLDGVWNLVSDPGLVPWIGSCYTVFSMVIAVMAPVMTAGFVLSFFKDASAMLRYHGLFNRHADIYLMSELNERSIALAADILSKRDEKRLVVFTDVFEKDDESNFELVSQAKRLGAICSKRDITEVGLKKTYGIYRRLYFISDSEDENVSQGLRLINRCRGDAFRAQLYRYWRRQSFLAREKNTAPQLLKCYWQLKMQELAERFNGEKLITKRMFFRWRKTLSLYNSPKTQFYVFATTPESEVLLNSVDNSWMKVRRVNENRNLVIDTLARYPLYRNAIGEGALSDYSKPKELNIVIIGLGGYGTELLKAVCWSTQMPGFFPTIHVFDLENGEEKIGAIAPELVEANDIHTVGESQYKIVFHNNIDVNSQAFCQELAGLRKITTVFVTLGNDELNISTALTVRMQFGRNKIRVGDAVPPIYAVVYSMSKSMTVKYSGGLMSIRGTSYGVTFIGDMRSRYSIESIEQPALEDRGRALHTQWAHTEESLLREEMSYNRYEYFRRSSMSQAFYEKLRTEIGIVEFSSDTADPAEIAHNNVLAIYEHMRWNAYMRSEGYIVTARKADRDDIAKTHHDLIPFAGLSDIEKLKDLIDRGIRAELASAGKHAEKSEEKKS